MQLGVVGQAGSPPRGRQVLRGRWRERQAAQHRHRNGDDDSIGRHLAVADAHAHAVVVVLHRTDRCAEPDCRAEPSGESLCEPLIAAGDSPGRSQGEFGCDVSE